MQKIFMIVLMVCTVVTARAQLSIQPQTHWVVSGNASMVLNNMNLTNNGSFNAGQGNIHFTGTNTTSISSASSISLANIHIAKSGAAALTLLSSLNVSGSVNFVSGNLDLNNNNIMLASNANLLNESETSRILGTNGGYVEVTRSLNAPNSTNPGGLGAFITSTANLGAVTIRRGHLPQQGIGLANSIQRYYQISTQNNNPGMTLRLKYFNAEMNNQNENIFVQYLSSDAGTTWQNLGMTTRSTTSNFVENTSVMQLGIFTLGADVVTGPVGSLSFSGTRKKSTEVQLNWTSQTESNMSHYILERKLSTELAFSQRATISSVALNGNSISPLNYKHNDLNSHTENSVYRLMIFDKNGASSYSNEITVAGKTNGAKGGGKPNNLMVDESLLNARVNGLSAIIEKSVMVGPNPNNGNFWFNLKGFEKNSSVSLYGIDGKMVRQFRVNNLERIQVAGLSRGMYLLKADGLDPVKIIVQ